MTEAQRQHMLTHLDRIDALLDQQLWIIGAMTALAIVAMLLLFREWAEDDLERGKEFYRKYGVWPW